MSFRLPAGVYRIKNPKSGTYITCSLEDPSIVHGWDSSPDNDNQKWELTAIGGDYAIRNVGNGRYLAKSGGNGSRIRADVNQTLWSLLELESGAWYISSGASCVDIHYGRNENGTPINLWPRRDALAKTWRFKRIGPKSTDAKLLEEALKRLAAVEEKANNQQNEPLTMMEALNTARDQVVAAEKTTADLRRHLAAAEGRYIPIVGFLPEPSRGQVPSLGGKKAGLGEPPIYTGEGPAASTGATDNRGPAPGPSGQTQGSSSTMGGTIGHQGNPESAILALETKTDRLQSSFAQTQEYLSSVGKFLRTIESKIPTIEAKAGKLEGVNGQIREEVSAVRVSQVVAGERLAGLDDKLQRIESRVDDLTEKLEQLQDTQDGGRLPEPPLFPGRD